MGKSNYIETNDGCMRYVLKRIRLLRESWIQSLEKRYGISSRHPQYCYSSVNFQQKNTKLYFEDYSTSTIWKQVIPARVSINERSSRGISSSRRYWGFGIHLPNITTLNKDIQHSSHRSKWFKHMVFFEEKPCDERKRNSILRGERWNFWSSSILGYALYCTAIQAVFWGHSTLEI